MLENEHYDLIVNGTGIIESIVACAASKCGISVLHLDKYGFYGRDYGSFCLDDFLSEELFSDAVDLSIELQTENSDYNFSGAVDRTNSCTETSISSAEVKGSSQVLESHHLHRPVPFPDRKMNSVSQTFHPACYGSSMKIDAARFNARDTQKLNPVFSGYESNNRSRVIMAKALKYSRQFNIGKLFAVHFSCHVFLRKSCFFYFRYFIKAVNERRKFR